MRLAGIKVTVFAFLVAMALIGILVYDIVGVAQTVLRILGTK